MLWATGMFQILTVTRAREEKMGRSGWVRGRQEIIGARAERSIDIANEKDRVVCLLVIVPFVTRAQREN